MRDNGCRIAVNIDDMMILDAPPGFLEALQTRLKVGSIGGFNKIGPETDFCGLLLERATEGASAIAKAETKITEISRPEQFWSGIGQLPWVAGATRPGISFEFLGPSTRGPDAWRDLNKCIRAVVGSPMAQTFAPLAQDRRIIGFCDARDKKGTTRQDYNVRRRRRQIARTSLV